MNIELTQEQAEFVQQIIADGKFNSAEELISDLLQLLQHKGQTYDSLREAIVMQCLPGLYG